MSMLRSLEVYASRAEQNPKSYLSRRLFDSEQFKRWRENILKNGTAADLQRYAKALHSAGVSEKLGMDGNHGS